MTEQHPSDNEADTGGIEIARKSERFKYFFSEEATTLVDQWKEHSSHAEPDHSEDAELPYNEESAIFCKLLHGELLELTQAHPRRAAELFAEIYRRQDQILLYKTGTDEAVLYLAGQDPALAAQVWGLFTALFPEEVDESANRILQELDVLSEAEYRHERDSTSTRPSLNAPTASRMAMVMFYIEHVSQQATS